jgi:hypothetical protein
MDNVPFAERSHAQALSSEADVSRQLAGFAANAAHVNSRIAPIYRILVSAAASDTDAATVLDDLTQHRRHGQGLIARSLTRSGALRPELRDAADLVHALMSPEMY